MSWKNPLPLALRPTEDPMSFLRMGCDETGLPLAPHPGAFGVKRRFHTHEGVDLYAPCSMPVMAVEPGEVVAVIPFTGPHANSPWWLPTYAVMVEGPSGVVLYGEIAPHISVGAKVVAGSLIGVVIPVLRHDKGRPRSMLHLELHQPGSRAAPEWLTHDEKPEALRDPTPFLLEAIADNV